jgi:hypothetical protein
MKMERKTERDEKKKTRERDMKKPGGQIETKQSTKQSKEKTPKEKKNQGATQQGVLVFAIVFVPIEKPRINNQFTAGRPLHHLLGFKSR